MAAVALTKMAQVAAWAQDRGMPWIALIATSSKRPLDEAKGHDKESGPIVTELGPLLLPEWVAVLNSMSTSGDFGKVAGTCAEFHGTYLFAHGNLSVTFPTEAKGGGTARAGTIPADIESHLLDGFLRTWAETARPKGLRSWHIEGAAVQADSHARPQGSLCSVLYAARDRGVDSDGEARGDQRGDRQSQLVASGFQDGRVGEKRQTRMGLHMHGIVGVVGNTLSVARANIADTDPRRTLRGEIGVAGQLAVVPHHLRRIAVQACHGEDRGALRWTRGRSTPG
jgi:hypothetical protein